jgi:hypothetical protein
LRRTLSKSIAKPTRGFSGAEDSMLDDETRRRRGLWKIGIGLTIIVIVIVLTMIMMPAYYG